MSQQHRRHQQTATAMGPFPSGLPREMEAGKRSAVSHTRPPYFCRPSNLLSVTWYLPDTLTMLSRQARERSVCFARQPSIWPTFGKIFQELTRLACAEPFQHLHGSDETQSVPRRAG